MKQQPKVMTIEDVEEAILLGQEQYHEVMADVLGQYYAPLIRFSQMLGGRNGQQLPFGMGQTGSGGLPQNIPANQDSDYPGQPGTQTAIVPDIPGVP
jgi:hypothetical protein